jgi:hypothetical protein
MESEEEMARDKMPAIGISAIGIPPVDAAWARPGGRSVNRERLIVGPAESAAFQKQELLSL